MSILRLINLCSICFYDDYLWWCFEIKFSIYYNTFVIFIHFRIECDKLAAIIYKIGDVMRVDITLIKIFEMLNIWTKRSNNKAGTFQIQMRLIKLCSFQNYLEKLWFVMRYLVLRSRNFDRRRPTIERSTKRSESIILCYVYDMLCYLWYVL